MKETISKKQLREFGLLIGIGFPLLIGLVIPAIGGHEFRPWTLWIGLPGLCLSIVAPKLLIFPYKGWIAIGHALGWLNSHIILGLIFLIVLQPIAFSMRLFGYDPLKRRRYVQSSYRENRQSHRTDLNRIF